MTTTFFVRRTFDLPSRRALVLSGDIVSGEVRAGMRVDLRLARRARRRQRWRQWKRWT